MNKRKEEVIIISKGSDKSNRTKLESKERRNDV
jgi:hypothetical protein